MVFVILRHENPMPKNSLQMQNINYLPGFYIAHQQYISAVIRTLCDVHSMLRDEWELPDSEMK